MLFFAKKERQSGANVDITSLFVRPLRPVCRLRLTSNAKINQLLDFAVAEIRNGFIRKSYPNKALGVLLYDFCVMGYDVELSYKGNPYYLMDDGEGVVSDSHFTERKMVFDSPMALVENFKIAGKTLLELATEIEDIEPM